MQLPASWYFYIAGLKNKEREEWHDKEVEKSAATRGQVLHLHFWVHKLFTQQGMDNGGRGKEEDEEGYEDEGYEEEEEV